MVTLLAQSRALAIYFTTLLCICSARPLPFAMAAFHPSGSPEHLEASIIPKTTPGFRFKMVSGKGKETRIGEVTTGLNPSSSIASRIPKLRDSCDACSVAKVRCTKKKPTCTRCGKRGIPCEYIATKRAGRPSRPLTQSTTDASQTSNNPRRSDVTNDVQVTSPPSSNTNTPPKGTLPASSMPQLMTTNPDALPEPVATSIDHTIASSALTSFDTELDGFFASLSPYPGLETPPHDFMSLPSCADSVSISLESSDPIALISEHDLSAAEDACSNVPFLTNPQISPNGEPSTTRHVESVPAALPTPSPCCCLTIALGLLKELLSGTEKACVQPDEQIYSGAAGSPLPTIQWLIADYQQTVEATDSILQCSCSQDVYLLAVLSIVGFKILDRYAAAGRAALIVKMTATTTMADKYNQFQQSPSNQNHVHTRSSSQDTGSSSSCIDIEDSGRVAAQMVLSELHHAQRLVNGFVTQLKEHRVDGGTGVGLDATRNSSSVLDILCDTRDTTRPFSTAMINQMEADLRRRLRNISMSIVDIIWQI